MFSRRDSDRERVLSDYSALSATDFSDSDAAAYDSDAALASERRWAHRSSRQGKKPPSAFVLLLCVLTCVCLRACAYVCAYVCADARRRMWPTVYANARALWPTVYANSRAHTIMVRWGY